MPTLFLSLAIGFVAGLRSMTALAAVAWGARLGWLRLSDTPLAFLDTTPAAYILAVLMVAELVADKLPFTPSRTRPGPFAGRIIAGALSGAALAAGTGEWLALGAVFGAVGAVLGTLGGYRARTGLVPTLKVPDYVVALVEDAMAIGVGFLIVAMS
jgi:uncharacterized membrane protein